MCILRFCMVLAITHLSYTMDVFPICQDLNNTAESCCPCFIDLMDSCNETCPEDYLSIKKQVDSFYCKLEPSPTPEATTTTGQMTITTGTTFETTTADLANETINTTEREKRPYIICSKSCPKGHFYNNETLECVECDKKCIECKTDGKTCHVCRFSYNDTCYAQCPDGTIVTGNEVDNGSALCVKEPETKEKSSNLPAIIGGSVGGVVVVVIVVIAIVWLCWRRRGSKDMSGTRIARSSRLEEQQLAREREREGKRKASQKVLQDYENTLPQKPWGQEILEHGDNVLRYTKDPTVKPKESPDASEGDLEIYENKDMIRLQQNVDTCGKQEEELNELLDVQEMGQAPAAPGPAQPKVSLPVTSKKAKKKTGKNVKKEKELENYMDMTGSSVNESGKLSDYENVQFDQIKQGRKAAVTKPDADLELYETPSSDPSAKNKGDNADLEDYENTKDVMTKMAASGKVTDDNSGDLEDYENMEVYENTRMSKTTK